MFREFCLLSFGLNLEHFIIIITKNSKTFGLHVNSGTIQSDIRIEKWEKATPLSEGQRQEKPSVLPTAGTWAVMGTGPWTRPRRSVTWLWTSYWTSMLPFLHLWNGEMVLLQERHRVVVRIKWDNTSKDLSIWHFKSASSMNIKLLIIINMTSRKFPWDLPSTLIKWKKTPTSQSSHEDQVKDVFSMLIKSDRYSYLVALIHRKDY